MTARKLGVTVSVDLYAATVTLRPVGTLTEHNVQGLLSLRRRAEHALPACIVSLDEELLRYESDRAHEALTDEWFRPLPGEAPADRQPVVDSRRDAA